MVQLLHAKCLAKTQTLSDTQVAEGAREEGDRQRKQVGLSVDIQALHFDLFSLSRVYTGVNLSVLRLIFSNDNELNYTERVKRSLNCHMV